MVIEALLAGPLGGCNIDIHARLPVSLSLFASLQNAGYENV